MSSVAPQDATMYWLSKRTANDLFLLYCFTDSGRPTAELRALVARRSARIPDLRVRLREVPGDLEYPSWIPCGFAAEQFMEHPLSESNWPTVLNVLGKLLGTGLDASVRPWRLHVFRDIDGAPGAEAGTAVVVVLQMSHALADGRSAARIARDLFAEPGAIEGDNTGSVSRSTPRQRASIGSVLLGSALVDSVLGLARMPFQVVRTVARGYRAYRAQRELAELTSTGQLPAPGPDFAPTSINPSIEVGAADHRVRMIVCAADRLRITDRTVTVVVLTAVSLALTRYLASRGAQVDRLGAQVPMALPDREASAPRNNYRNLGVDLFVDEPDLRVRAQRIADALADRATRARHPLLAAQDRVTAVVPATLLRRDVDRLPLDTVPDSIAGHTVVSSVHRGAADLTFGGGRVRFTAGFPALGSVMHLTHGVHGLGEDPDGHGATVTISIHADTAALPDIDTYSELLVAALEEAAAAHADGVVD
ncbi:wax ester/triacylglycerol synthase domain-containing protein [Nocardia sp. KC 131]|uniref:wax ester/triacylglycerol synthase domain-containing protein n=1 Tax=Nocardia arseniciresistens TaxID=3392119 RepID=UPI00398E7630